MPFCAAAGHEDTIVHTPELLARRRLLGVPGPVRLRTRAEAYGLRIAAIENMPRTFLRPLPQGLPGRVTSRSRRCTRRSATRPRLASPAWGTISCPSACGAPAATPSAVVAPG